MARARLCKTNVRARGCHSAWDALRSRAGALCMHRRRRLDGQWHLRHRWPGMVQAARVRESAVPLQQSAKPRACVHTRCQAAVRPLSCPGAARPGGRPGWNSVVVPHCDSVGITARPWCPQDYFMRFTLDTFATIGFGKPLHAIEQDDLQFNKAFDYVRAMCLAEHARSLSTWLLADPNVDIASHLQGLVVAPVSQRQGWLTDCAVAG